MAKQSKEILTKEFIENELRFYNRADIRASAVMTACCAPIGIVMLLIFLATASVFPLLWVRVLMTVFLALLSLSPTLAGLYSLCVALAEKKVLEQGGYDVSVYTVAYKTERQNRRHTEELLQFMGFKAVKVGHTVYQLTSEGDTFYLVTYPTRKHTVKLLYATKMYEYKG